MKSPISQSRARNNAKAFNEHFNANYKSEKDLFISKWSNFFILHPKRIELMESFKIELNNLIKKQK